MQVELVNYTPNPEAFTAYIARVSNPENQDNPDYARLIKYLLTNSHYSPFEHSYFTFKIVTSRAIATQILRHRSFTFQEYSQRYSVVNEIEPVELRKQATKNRQSSTEVFDPLVTLYDTDHDEPASIAINRLFRYAQRVYDQLIRAGIAKESARFIMPLASQTTLYMTGSIRSYIHYLALRTDHHTQKEHRLIADEIEKCLRILLPNVFAALDSIRMIKENSDKFLQVLDKYGITDAEVLEKLLADSL